MEELKRMIKEMEDIQKNIVLKKLQKSSEMFQKGEYDVENPQKELNISSNEIILLKEILEEKGFIDGKDFLSVDSWGTYPDDPDNFSMTFKIDGKMITVETSSYNEQSEVFYQDNVFDLGMIRVEDEEDKEKVSNFIKNGKEFDLSSLEEKKDNSLKAIKKKIVLDKMKYIESAKTKEDKEDIKYDFFTRSEALTLLEQLRGKDEYIDSSEDEVDITDFWEAEYNDGIDGFEHTYQTVHYHTIRIGDKLISFDDRDGVNTIIEDYEDYKSKYGPLSIKALTSSQLEAIMNGEQEQVLGQEDRRKIFENDLLRDDVVEYFSSKTFEELEKEYGPEVSRMVGFEQKNMHHCYDLWQHTLHTVEAVDTTRLTDEQAKKLKVAAFFHDIGKPDVVGFNPRTEQQNFYNHAIHSVDIATPILTRLGYSEDEIAQIGFFIGHHDDFINYKNNLPQKDKSHAFFREVNPSTVGEIIVQNKYDFDKLGYPSYLPTRTGNKEVDDKNNATNNANKLKIRHICYALNNDGTAPKFMDFKGQPINISVDMDDVQSKVFSGEFDASYVPSLEDYKLLLELCKADARAQQKEVKQTIKGKDGKSKEIIVDTRERKVQTMEQIGQVMPQAYKEIENRDKFLSSIFRSATQKAIARDRNAQSKDLAQEYEQQMHSNDQQSLDN